MSTPTSGWVQRADYRGKTTFVDEKAGIWMTPYIRAETYTSRYDLKRAIDRKLDAPTPPPPEPTYPKRYFYTNSKGTWEIIEESENVFAYISAITGNRHFVGYNTLGGVKNLIDGIPSIPPIIPPNGVNGNGIIPAADGGYVELLKGFVLMYGLYLVSTHLDKINLKFLSKPLIKLRKKG